MDSYIYEELAQTARENFVDHQFGLKIYIERDNKRGISENRLQKYRASGKFTVKPLEEDFHLIGFLDAIAWMARNGYINFKKVEEESDESFELHDNADELEKKLIKCVITDAAMLKQLCADVQCDSWNFD